MSATAPNIDAIRKRHFPIKLESGYEIRSATREECHACVRAHAQEIFGKSNDRYLNFDESRKETWPPMHALRAGAHSECFLFIDPQGEPVGWNMSESEDWITYYLRNTGIRPAHQSKGVYSAFEEAISKFCAEIGYERIVSQHKGTNRRILIMKLKAGYFLSGLELTERWGALFKVVKFLKDDRNANYISNFGQADHT